MAVIGPNANITETLLSNYHGQRCMDNTYNCIVSPLKAVTQANVNGKVGGSIHCIDPFLQTTYAKGCDILGTDTSGFNEAVSIAKQADVAVIFVGLNQSVEVCKWNCSSD